ncbi:hypothetical protein P0D72_24415 [Paraburkholderia sediminicola]
MKKPPPKGRFFIVLAKPAGGVESAESTQQAGQQDAFAGEEAHEFCQ